MTTCRYCHTEIEGGQVPYCSMQHMLWDFFGTPILHDVAHRRRREGGPRPRFDDEAEQYVRDIAASIKGKRRARR